MTPRDTSFVFIIESPSEEDILDGRTEGRALSEALRLSNIDGWYSLATSKKMFFKAITERLYQAISNFPNKVPIMHFSMHGDQEGIELTNGDVIKWAELQQALSPLNNALEHGSLICMSSCYGVSGIRMAMNEDTDKPFWALIGNSKSTQWNDAAVAYITFYHQLFKGRSLEIIVNAMKIASGDSNFMLYSGHKVKSDWASYMNETRQSNSPNALNDLLQSSTQNI
ncbi:MAG: hypothetical protein COC03_06985 [Robiginitomaculum sp.]|nr:MAG: hypothetical protein COC03_06985 [Robiginitomaculum sp.]